MRVEKNGFIQFETSIANTRNWLKEQSKNGRANGYSTGTNGNGHTHENISEMQELFVSSDTNHTNGNGSHEIMPPPSVLIDVWVSKSKSRPKKQANLPNRVININMTPKYELRQYLNKRQARKLVRKQQEHPIPQRR